jgi:hypothetical protein
MSRRRYTAEQIIGLLREADVAWLSTRGKNLGVGECRVEVYANDIYGKQYLYGCGKMKTFRPEYS